MPKVFVVIPNWNGLDFIRPCLDSLKNQSLKATVIVVDNGSTDGSWELIEKDYPSVELVKLPTNTGFAGGVNTGISRALKENAENIILFNNDAIADKDFVKNLAESAAENSKYGIVTCKFMLMDKKHLDSTGDFYSVWGLPSPRGRNELDRGQYDNDLEVFGATGGASLYKAGLFKDIGLFDEDFFAYFEDVDISYRAQLAGWKVRYEPTAKAYHHLSATSSRLGDFARYHSAKNFLLLYAKNMPFWLYIKHLPFFTIQFLRMMLGSIKRRKFKVFLKGTWAAIKLHPSTRKKRKHIQSTRKASVKYIDSVLLHKLPPRPPVIGEVKQ